MNAPFLICLAIGLLLAVLAGCAGPAEMQRERPSSSLSDDPWYLGRAGIAANDVRLPPPVPIQVRRRYRAEHVPARRENSWMAWLTVIPVKGGNGGCVEVFSLGYEWVTMQNGEYRPSGGYTQFWLPGDTVWGGWFPFDDRTWFGQGMIGKEDFRVEKRPIDNDQSYCATVDAAKYHGDRPAAGHIWLKRWPRDIAPAGTVRMRIRATFRVVGDVLCNVGLDRYRTAEADPTPVQEVIVSDTYGGEHDYVRVVLETPDIEWQD